jgi:hypothetical protein
VQPGFRQQHNNKNKNKNKNDQRSERPFATGCYIKTGRVLVGGKRKIEKQERTACIFRRERLSEDFLPGSLMTTETPAQATRLFMAKDKGGF